MDCPRCGSHMIYTRFNRREVVDHTAFMIEEQRNECGKCGVSLTLRTPDTIQVIGISKA